MSFPPAVAGSKVTVDDPDFALHVVSPIPPQ
jgi:hypothetical protein